MTSKLIEKRKTPEDETETTHHGETSSASDSLSVSSGKINAFTALMTAKPQPKKIKYSAIPGLNALGVYLDHPETFPPDQVIGFSESAVYIWDVYPKGSVHALVLSRDTNKRHMDPYDAFRDKEFVEEMKTEAQNLRKLVAKELKRMYGKYSETDKKRAEYEKRLANGEVKDGEEAPNGRDWEAEVSVGFHSQPSMNHLHIHVISRDCHSASLKKGQHYNSFKTSFFVELNDLPFETRQAEDTNKALADSEVAGPYTCWRCKKSFGRRFKELKEHLEIEFEAWKRE